MRKLTIVMALLGLLLTVVPSTLVFVEKISWGLHSRLMFAGMLLWFVFAPMGMKSKES